MQLLLVDDMKLINNTLHDLFTKKGYKADQAFTLAEALDRISEKAYDYIVLDLILPDGEGEELLQNVLRGSKRQSRIIVLTSDDDMQRRQYFFQNGALDYFVKNQSLEFIASKIDKLIQNTAENHKSTIAVVDDSTFMRNSLKSLLEVRNYRVITASNAKSGMQMLMEDEASLLILDLEMPNMRGDEMLDKLKRNPRFIELPVIILSGSNDRDAIARVMKSGADDFIQKPYAAEELLLKVDAFISSHRKARALEHREQLLQEYQRVVDIADIVCKTDPEGVITYVNDQFCAYSGYSAHELLGQKISIVRHPEMPDEFYTEMWKTISGKRSWSGYFRNRRKDGSDYYIDSTIAPLLDEEGEIEHYIALSHDITALMQAKAISEEIAHAKSEFLAHMSHEIRTPLNAISGYLHLLLQGDLDNTQRKYLDVVDNSSKMLMDLINNILDQAKAQSGKLELNPEPTSLKNELEPIISLFNAKANEAAIRLLVFIDPRLPKRVDVDVLRLKQILSNLIGNAIKFTPDDGEVRVTIRQKSRVEDHVTVEFTVEDTGIGISEEAQDKIFSPYLQATNTISKHFGGTGLGLSISQEYVSLLGGELCLKSALDKGSSFSFALDLPIDGPLAALPATSVKHVAIYTDTTYSEHEIEFISEYLHAYGVSADHTISYKPVSDADLHIIIDHQCRSENLANLMEALPSEKVLLLTDAMQKGQTFAERFAGLQVFQPPLSSKEWDSLLHFAHASKHNGTYGKNPFADKKVLIVEDNDVNRMLLSILLDEQGIASESAVSGLEAVQMCKENPYDLILMDIHMPELNGIEAAKQIRGIEAYRSVPIAIISGVEGLKANFDDYDTTLYDFMLLKPIDTEKLNSLISELWA